MTRYAHCAGAVRSEGHRDVHPRAAGDQEECPQPHQQRGGAHQGHPHHRGHAQGGHLHYITLHYIALHYITLYDITLHFTLLYKSS